MKAFLLILFTYLLASAAFTQTMQGTIKPGSQPRTIDIYLKPSASFSQKDEAMTFTLAIPATVSPAPSMGSTGPQPNNTGPVSGISGLQPTFIVNNLNSTTREVVVNTQTINGSSYFIYTFIFAGTATANHSWTANTEQLIFSIQFNGCTNNCNPNNQMLVNLQNGGSQGISYWYFQPNTLGDITNYPAPFYGNTQSTAPTNGGSSDGSALSYIALAAPVSLPVKLSQFTATAKDCNVILNWQVSNQIHSTQYTIERSLNGSDFVEIAHLPTTTNNTFSYTDKTSARGTSYYRLKILENDGSITYGSMKQVNNNCSLLNRVQVYPTLSVGLINVKLSTGYEASSVRVLNGLGQEVVTDISKRQNRTINLSRLSNGTYFVQVIHNNLVVENVKIVLQK